MAPDSCTEVVLLVRGGFDREVLRCLIHASCWCMCTFLPLNGRRS